MMLLVALLIVVFAIVGWAVMAYNGLIRGRNQVDQAWADVDTELKRRYDLIPNIVETVKGYAAHEQETLNAVVEARNRAMAATSPGEQAQAEGLLTGALRQLFALAEAYPDLKANQNFLQLQQELATTENRIQETRRFYNATVREFNNSVESVPTNIVANAFGFHRREFFEVEDESVREAPQVSFT